MFTNSSQRGDQKKTKIETVKSFDIFLVPFFFNHKASSFFSFGLSCNQLLLWTCELLIILFTWATLAFVLGIPSMLKATLHLILIPSISVTGKWVGFNFQIFLFPLPMTLVTITKRSRCCNCSHHLLQTWTWFIIYADSNLVRDKFWIRLVLEF